VKLPKEKGLGLGETFVRACYNWEKGWCCVLVSWGVEKVSLGTIWFTYLHCCQQWNHQIKLGSEIKQHGSIFDSLDFEKNKQMLNGNLSDLKSIRLIYRI